MRMLAVIAVVWLAACGGTARVEPDAGVDATAVTPDANTFGAAVGEPCIPDDAFPFCARGAGRCLRELPTPTCRRLCVNHACASDEYAADLGYCVCLPLPHARGE